MYAWIWRMLPFGRPGKIIGSLALVATAVCLLWFVVFPWAEPILPFDDVQVGTEGGPGDFAPDPGLPDGTPQPGASGQPEESMHSGGDYDIPYDPESNNPVPPPSR